MTGAIFSCSSEGLVTIQVVGPVTTKQILGFVHDFFQDSENLGKDLLVDSSKMDFVPDFNEFNHMVRLIIAFLAKSQNKTAIVKHFSKLPMVEADYFKEMAVSHSLQVDVFNSVEEARLWLSS